jgi:hypothetical protein
MRKGTTAARRAARPASARAAAAGKKQRKQAGSVETLTAILGQTRTAQRRLLILVGRLRAAEQAITEALGGAAHAAPPAPPGPLAPQARPAAASANGRRRPRPV